LRIPGIAAKWLFILCLPLLLLTASLCWAVNSAWLYEYGFEKYNVGQVITKHPVTYTGWQFPLCCHAALPGLEVRN